jgi:hypothetical protein
VCSSDLLAELLARTGQDDVEAAFVQLAYAPAGAAAGGGEAHR